MRNDATSWEIERSSELLLGDYGLSIWWPLYSLPCTARPISRESTALVQVTCLCEMSIFEAPPDN